MEIAETASLKNRAMKKLERDAGPLIIDALNGPLAVQTAALLNADTREKAREV